MKKTNKGYTVVPILILVLLFVGIALLLYFTLNTDSDPQTSTSRIIKNNIENIKDSLQKDTLYTLVDTGQASCYNTSNKINCPAEGQSFYGQDAQYLGTPPSYKNNGDGTVTDLNTGLIWTKGYFGKLSFDEGPEYAESLTVGNYDDWRVPTIKELYSLMDFSGTTGSGGSQSDNTVPDDAVPYINTGYFEFAYGLEGERYIDSQWLTTTKYVSTTMNGDETMFGVNFADGRIKGYGFYNLSNPRIEKKFYARFVRGNSYGENKFVDNKDDTITNQSTGLMWTKKDNGHYNIGHAEYDGLNWQEALVYCEELSIAHYNDWRLPNAKELQGIIDYTRSPDTTNSAAINPVFNVTSITDEGGNKNYPFYWTGTTHLEGRELASGAVYVAFGEALGFMNGKWLDVHGAGAQRSDPKAGDPKDYPNGHGPQGDAIRIYNFVRCVRGGTATPSDGEDPSTLVGTSDGQSSQQNPPPPSQNNSPLDNQPPPEAITACLNKSLNSSCSFTSPQGIVTGSCKNINSRLACVPNNQ